MTTPHGTQYPTLGDPGHSPTELLRACPARHPFFSIRTETRAPRRIAQPSRSWLLVGAGCGNRTHDLMITRCNRGVHRVSGGAGSWRLSCGFAGQAFTAYRFVPANSEPFVDNPWTLGARRQCVVAADAANCGPTPAPSVDWFVGWVVGRGGSARVTTPQGRRRSSAVGPLSARSVEPSPLGIASCALVLTCSAPDTAVSLTVSTASRAGSLRLSTTS